MARYFTLICWFFIFLVCSNCENNSTANTEDAEPSFLLAEYVDSTTLANVLQIKTAFDDGFRAGYNDQPLSYVYEQHAIRLRQDLLNEEHSTSVYPFNGRFSLANHAEQASQLPFLTDACGFQDSETEEVVNYYCLSLDESFFAYLSDLGKQNLALGRFADAYKESKAITPRMRQDLVLNSDDFYFQNSDHQLVYALVQMMINEEFIAHKKILKVE